MDNILERLLALPPAENGERLKVTRIGHPARVMAHEGILDSTLEVKATRTDQVYPGSLRLSCLYVPARQTWQKT